MNRRDVFSLLIPALLSGTVSAAEIQIAVASNFMATMHEIVAEFKKETGHNVRLVAGSSGKFYAQIKHGAPFLAFFSADETKPRQLERDGLAVPGTRFTYATGRLALWSPQPGFIVAEHKVLQESAFGRLAIANPLHAPYGAAALEVLQRLGLADRLRGKLVQGENIAQAYQFVESGNAGLGFVALSQLMTRGMLKTGSVWIVPAELHRPIRQDAVLLQAGAADSEQATAARELLHFVRSATARSIIAAHGYQTGAGP